MSRNYIQKKSAKPKLASNQNVSSLYDEYKVPESPDNVNDNDSDEEDQDGDKDDLEIGLH